MKQLKWFVFTVTWAVLIIVAWRVVPDRAGIVDWPVWARWILTLLASEIYLCRSSNTRMKRAVREGGK